MTEPARRAIVLVDHGSRREEANALLEAVAGRARRVLDGAVVIAAHMELAEPSLPAAIVLAAAAGATEVVVVPFFLSPGRHTVEDLPRLCAEGAAAAGGVRWRLTAPLGEDDLILEIIRRRVADER